MNTYHIDIDFGISGKSWKLVTAEYHHGDRPLGRSQLELDTKHGQMLIHEHAPNNGDSIKGLGVNTLATLLSILEEEQLTTPDWIVEYPGPKSDHILRRLREIGIIHRWDTGKPVRLVGYAGSWRMGLESYIRRKHRVVDYSDPDAVWVSELKPGKTCIGTWFETTIPAYSERSGDVCVLAYKNKLSVEGFHPNPDPDERIPGLGTYTEIQIIEEMMKRHPELTTIELPSMTDLRVEHLIKRDIIRSEHLKFVQCPPTEFSLDEYLAKTKAYFSQETKKTINSFEFYR